LDRLRLIDAADALARRGRLLSAPGLPEIAVCRHWIYSQIAEQAAGVAPQPWELPDRLEPARVAATLSSADLERLARRGQPRWWPTTPTGSSSSTKRRASLLGWPPEALVGQRLTVVIPPELREAHLAGFSRLQVTGRGASSALPCR
jgi:hypothetical protein